LVLSGKITIFVGSENFRSDLSSWSVLGKNALTTYAWVPDFTAYVSDGPCRCIQIRHSDFAEAVDASVVERRAAENKDGIHHFYSVGASCDGDVLSVGDSARSTTSSNDGHVPNRREKILARLFNSGTPTTLGEIQDGESSKRIVSGSVQFAKENVVILVDSHDDNTNEDENKLQETNGTNNGTPEIEANGPDKSGSSS
jgi:hypothetical protein